MELKNKIAVVTGVSKGVGLEVVKQLLEKGTIVAGWGRTAPDLRHENFHFFSCDVSREDQVEKAYSATVQKLGEDIRILVNNAGVGAVMPLLGSPVDDMEDMITLNVTALMRLAYAFGRRECGSRYRWTGVLLGMLGSLVTIFVFSDGQQRLPSVAAGSRVHGA